LLIEDITCLMEAFSRLDVTIPFFEDLLNGVNLNGLYQPYSYDSSNSKILMMLLFFQPFTNSDIGLESIRTSASFLTVFTVLGTIILVLACVVVFVQIFWSLFRYAIQSCISSFDYYAFQFADC